MIIVRHHLRFCRQAVLTPVPHLTAHLASDLSDPVGFQSLWQCEQVQITRLYSPSWCLTAAMHVFCARGTLA